MVGAAACQIRLFFSRGDPGLLSSPRRPDPRQESAEHKKSSIILQAAAALYTYLCVDTRSSPDHGAATYVGPPGDGFTAQSLCPRPPHRTAARPDSQTP